MICAGHVDHLHFFIIIHIFVFLTLGLIFDDAFPGVSVNRDFLFFLTRITDGTVAM